MLTILKQRLPVALLLGVISAVSAAVPAWTQPLLSPAEGHRAAAAALERGDLAAAREAFEAMITKDPGDAMAWLGLAATASAAGNPTEALHAARQAAHLAPELGETHLALAKALIAAGRPNEALEAAGRCRERAPREVRCYLLPALVLRDSDRAGEALELLAEGYERLPRAELAQQAALLALATGDHERALSVANDALSREPRLGDLHLVKALALAADPGGREEAATWFASAFELGVGSEGQARGEWARVLAELGRWQEATAQLEQVVELMPERAEGYFRLAAARRQIGDEAGAELAFARYQELDAARTAAVRRAREIGTALNEAQELANQSRLGEAWSRLEEIDEAGEAEPRVWVLRAKLLYASERIEDARVAAAKAVSLAPFATEPSHLLALFGLATNRYDEAAIAAEHVLTLEPDFGEAWALRGSALARLARPDEAAASFERALALGFESAGLRRDYAGVLSDLGRSEESLEQLEAHRRLTAGEG